MSYPLTEEHRASFAADGYVRLPGFLTEAELAPIEEVYEAFLRGEIDVAGRDFCDMASTYGGGDEERRRVAEGFAVVNVMLPRRYHAPLRGNVYERRAEEVARALCGGDMVLDYDQLVAKRPGREDAVFHWHQDLAYWPRTEDTRTATFWLALDETARDNGCVRFVAGSHREERLRVHRPLHGDRDASHTMVAEVDEGVELVEDAVLRRGDVTVHQERTVHGSGGNGSERWRRGYVVAFRSEATVRAERAMGFTHSHNDEIEVLRGLDRTGDGLAAD